MPLCSTSPQRSRSRACARSWARRCTRSTSAPRCISISILIRGHPRHQPQHTQPRSPPPAPSPLSLTSLARAGASAHTRRPRTPLDASITRQQSTRSIGATGSSGARCIPWADVERALNRRSAAMACSKGVHRIECHMTSRQVSPSRQVARGTPRPLPVVEPSVGRRMERRAEPSHSRHFRTLAQKSASFLSLSGQVGALASPTPSLVSAPPDVLQPWVRHFLTLFV